MGRRIKSDKGKKTTLPIKDDKLLDRVMDYLQIECDHAKTDIKKYQADRNYMLFLIGLNTAFRAEDLLQLKVKDIEKGYVSIKENKTGKWQHFRMNKQFHEDIMNYVKKWKLVSNDYLFMGQKKNQTVKGRSYKIIYPITRQNCQRSIFPKVIEACGIDFTFGLHSLRKTFGYMWYKHGGSLLTLQKMYNHYAPEVTLLYVMWDEQDISKERESIYIGRNKRK